MMKGSVQGVCNKGNHEGTHRSGPGTPKAVASEYLASNGRWQPESSIFTIRGAY